VTLFDPAYAAWPDLANQKAFIAPARNGMDRKTGKLKQGWAHVEQSLEVIFMTHFHERVLRGWVGSFVPRLLGESIVPGIITRFFWSIISAIELFEPDYRITQVFFMGNALAQWSPPLTVTSAADLIRAGDVIFRQEGIYYPRGHLGDFTPYQTAITGLKSGGGGNP
jgi:hypothetical protein